MLPYYDEDEDFMLCHEFCALWKKDLPDLRPDMYRIISDVLYDDKYSGMNVYAFQKPHQYHSYWEQAVEIITHLADMQGCDVETIIGTMPCHLFVKPPRMMYLHTTIGGISTAKTIVKKYGLEPEIFENKYGTKMVKQKG